MRVKAASPSAGRGQRGFTLIEVCIALLVMMIAGLAVASLFSWSIRYNAGAADRAIALSIGQQQMERLRKAPPPDPSLAPGTTTVTVTRSGRQYEVKTTVCNDATCYGSSSLLVLTVEVKALAEESQWGSLPVKLVTRRTSVAVGDYFK